MRLRVWFSLVLLLYIAPARAENWAPEEFEILSGPATPYTALAIRKTESEVELAVEIDPAGAPVVSVELGIAAANTVIQKQKKEAAGGGRVQLSFKLPVSQLVSAPADWERLRVGFTVAWGGGAFGQDRQRERFRHGGIGAVHGGLSSAPADWLPLNLAEHSLAVIDRKNKIWIHLNQPLDGKATVVIEDPSGKRVRNLISGRSFSKGAQRIEWDGLDDAGKVVPPGEYRWRSIHHPGVTPNYLFSFGNDGTPPWRTGSGTDMWGPDHSVLLSAAANADYTFLGGSVAESGYAIVAVDADGIKRMHYNPLMGTGIEKVCLAADAQYLYAAHDGFAWGQHIDRKKPDWKGTQNISITRFEIKNGKIAEYKNKKFVQVASNEIGPGSANKTARETSLRGMALLNGTLYISDYHAGRVIAVDPKTGEKSGEFKLEKPGTLAAYGADLLAVSGSSVVKVALPGGQSTPFIQSETLDPQGLVADAQKNIFVSDGKSHTVRVFDSGGKQIKEIGTPGGPYAGPYKPERLINPRGLALAPNGWLWVCEDRNSPKRVSAWDAASGKIVKEKWGPTAYGASGAGFDYEDHTRWVGQGGLWSVDFEKKTSACKALLKPESGHGADSLMHYRFVHQDGRTFTVGMGQITLISELLADGSQKDLAMIGQTHRYSFWQNWKPPQVFIDAFNAAYPKLTGKHSDKGPGFLWVDKNGDGEQQGEEFEFSTSADGFAGGYWGHDIHDLTIRIPATVKGKRVIVVLKPEGYLPGGAPKYPSLNEAIARGVPVAELDRNEVETSIDRFGNMICNTDPEMKAFSPEGKLLWTYPNRWSNVHGSHNAPLPETGVLQGSLFFLGMAPLDDKADVFVVNGNHGRFFVLTTDGLYVDEMFKDVRMGGALDAYLIGGECFGGMFARSKKDGNYYLQSGHTDYRIFRLDGLSQVSRGEGTLQVKPEQIIAAERTVASQVAKKSARKEFTVPMVAKAPVIDGKDDDWSGAVIQWDKSGQFPVSARIASDDQMLYLYYNVSDNSPWVNGGKDSTLLFKTGDSVDLQIGASAIANAARTQPVPGDMRLLIAPFEGKNIAVLYRHRLGGAKENPVTFNCPWRSESVDSVKVLENAKIAVLKENNRYRVEAAIPLAELSLKDASGRKLKGDVGVIYGDPAGTINMLRSYWSNQNTGLVNDVPGEIMLSPHLWGTFTFQKN
ncbi:MAG TPA: FlgD immunoglobulin-like domain containing protein [Planctomycetota bacterium]|nr:FlgD immunoglobulin-like domain containing protein [Planctomycetota bacterium]